MQTLPQALLQTAADPKMTDRYRVISTKDVIDIMEDQGYGVQKFKVDKTKKFDPDFGRHMVVFRKPDETALVGEVAPQFIWTNSHNGRCSGQMRAGLYRFICENGLIIGQDFAKDRILHSKTMADQVIERVRRLSSNTVSLFSKIEEWSKIELSEDKRNYFASEALKLRFGEERAKSYDSATLLGIRRQQDEGYDLWKTFNRIQENAMKGDFLGKNQNGRQVHARGIKGITQDLTFNEGLWKLAEEMA